MTESELDRWYFGGRWYSTTVVSWVSVRDGLGLELDDVAPAPGQGAVLEAFRDDTTGNLTFTAHVTDPLPFELVERFIAEARDQLTRSSHWTRVNAACERVGSAGRRFVFFVEPCGCAATS